MKNLYLLIVAFFIFSHSLNAQRTIKFNLNKVDAGTHDCDGWGAGDSDWRMSWEGSEVNNQCYSFGSANNPCGNFGCNYNYNLFYDAEIICRSDWPTGALDYTVYGDEADNVEGCVGNISVGFDFNMNRSETFPTYQSNTTINVNSGNWISLVINECNSSDFVRYKANWIIGGSWQTTKNQNNSGYLTNTTCATAIPFTFPNSSGWHTVESQHIIRCASEVWYKFDLNTDIDYFEIDMFNDDGSVAVYYDCNGCAITNEAGVFDKDFLSNNPPQGTYYVKLTGGNDYFDLDIRYGATVTRPANDLICNAIDLGTINSGNTVTGNGNNTNASTEELCALDEPNNDENDETVWYKFTIGSNPGAFISVDIDASGVCTPWMELYKESTSLSCPLNPSTNGFTALVDIANGGIDGYYELDCPVQGDVYYFQVEITGLCDVGSFTYEVIHAPQPPANDLPCGAIDIAAGTFNNYTPASSTGQNNTNASNCNEPDPAWTTDGNHQGIWYKLHPVGQDLIIDANNTGSDDIDIQLAVYEGNPSCNNLVYKDRDWTVPLYDEDMYINCLDPTKDYYLIVDGANATGVTPATIEGEFSLNIYYPREGGRDLCAYSAANWDGTPHIGTVPNGGNFTYNNLANLCGFDDAGRATLGLPVPSFTVDNGVLFQFTPPASGSVKINAHSDPVLGGLLGVGGGDEINLEMAVYESSTGNCTGAFTIVNWESYADGVGFNEEMIVNCLDPSKDYWLLVDGEGPNYTGYFDIRMEDYGVTTPNDLQQNAIAFTTDATTLTNWNTCNSNVTVTLNNQNNYCADNVNEPSPSAWTPLPATAQPVWYTFVAPPSGKLEIRFTTVTSNPLNQKYINGKLAVYDLPNGENIATYNFLSADEVESDYDVGSADEDMIVECLTPGRTYYLMVDGKETIAPGGSEWFRGEFYLEFESDPRDSPAPNDLLCDKKPLGDPTGGSVGSDVNDATLLNSPARGAACMRAENTFCASTIGNPPVNGFSLWGFDNTVWYSFVGPTSGAVRIEIDGAQGLGDDFIPQVVVFESSDNTCSGTLYDLQANSNVANNSTSLDVNCLNTGQIYFVAVDGGSVGFGVDGYFEIKVTEIVPTEFPPSNNDICDAKIITPFSGIVTISNDTNRCANREASIPEPSTFTRDHTVWYQFITPNGAGPYAISTAVSSSGVWPFGDAVDPQVAVYESSDGTCNGTITEKYSDFTGATPFIENDEIHCLEPNTHYWIMVDGSALNSQGFFDITIQSIVANPVAINNNICDLVDLGTLGATSGNSIGLGTDYNNFCADTELGETVPDAFAIEQTVWFKFTTPTLGSASDGVNVDFEVLNDPNSLGDWIDLQLALYLSDDGTCSGNMTEIESAYNPVGFSETLNDICLKQNTTYYIQVDGGVNGQGYFTIEVKNDGISAQPVNDDFANATTLTLGVTMSGDNNCATIEAGEPHAGTDVQKSVWYKFTAPASGRAEIRTADTDGALSGLDPEWRLYESDGTPLAVNALVDVVQDYTPLLDDVEEYECFFPGREYYIQVDGTTIGGDEGTFDITVTDLDVNYTTTTEPANNLCANAIDIAVQTESCQFSTGTWQLKNYGEPTRTVDDVNSCGQNCGEIWYKFTMPATGFVKVEGNDDLGLAGVNNSELVIIAYRGTCGNFTQIKCDIGGFGEDVDYSITGTAGETIYLQVFDDASNAKDFNENFEICVSQRCSADDCDDALVAPNILSLGEQCFDVRDAGGENIAGGDAGYGVGGVYTDNPTNSVYYSFTTDDFCWGYELIIKTTDIGNSGVLGGPELVVTVYQDDGTPCSHNVSGEPTLDIQTFNLATYPSGVDYHINYTVGNNANDIKANTRYIIQIEGNSTTVDGTIEVRKVCDGREWNYPISPTTTSNAYCFVDNWRHYYNDGGTPTDASDDTLIFSIKPNSNIFDGVATIYLDATVGFAETAGVEASWTMKRHWDFDLTSGSIVNPIDIKFYYKASEKQEIITLAQNYATANSLTYEPFEWFKSANGTDFNVAAHVTPPIVIAGFGSGSGPNITGGATQSTNANITLVCQDYEADNINATCNDIHYVVYEGLTGFSGGTGATGAGGGGSPLPIELLSFEGENIVEGNLLEWTTSMEINNEIFELLHSTDGKHFETIATLAGAGNSNENIYYNFLHKTFINGINYYQLKNIDNDGDFELSDIIYINNFKEDKESALLLLYPNPSSTKEIFIDAFIAEQGIYTIEVYDLVGKLAFTHKISLNSGKVTIPINFEGYSSGPYIVEMINPYTGKRIKKKYIRTK